jgi:FAD/FMN-containing dehydrogenase
MLQTLGRWWRSFAWASVRECHPTQTHPTDTGLDSRALATKGVEMTTVALDAERVDALSAVLSGTLLQFGDLYEEARRVHNGLIDRRPALIARCHGTADIVDAVRFARDNELEISVRGGGHSVAGRAVTEGGLMIDLAPMKGIRVDPGARTVRAQTGVIWRELNRETALHGLATTGGLISTTGIAGYTLGGGLGWLMSNYGLAADNLLGVELVTAAGDVLEVTEDSNPDLMWALRGGGGNFGIAASLEYRLHPLETIYGGLVAHPFEAAKEVLTFVRDFAPTLSDDAGVVAAFVHAPDGSGMKLAAYLLFHTGELERAQAELQPALSFGPPVLTQVGPMPYPVMNTLLDDGYPRGALNYWKSTFLSSLDDDLIDSLVAAYSEVPSPMTAIIFEYFHGAVTRVGADETAVPHREESFNVLIPGEWLDPADTERNVEWTRETFALLEPFRAGRRWLNYLDDDDARDAVQAAYGPNYERLARIKRKYDPENVFHLNHNIEPAA